MPYYELKNGDFIDKGKMFFDPKFLEGMPEGKIYINFKAIK